MKFKTFLAMYRNIIILLWWIIILVVFKITTNFEFHHGLSILFVFLVVLVPFTFYLITKVYQQKLIQAKKNRKGSYYQRIKKDFEGKVFEKNLIFPLEEYIGHIDIKIENDEIKLLHPQLICTFQQKKATIQIVDTRVCYAYYYSFQIDRIHTYNTLHMQYHDTSYLYHMMLNRIQLLRQDVLLYQENKNSCLLTNLEQTKVLYKENMKHRQKEKYKQVKTIDIQKNAL